jgi:hypothetical protein
MTSRPANGRYELTRGFDEDFIPASAGPGPTRVASRSVEQPETRKHRVTSRFNTESGELLIDLGWCEPDRERQSINSAIRFAKRQGTLRLITVSIAAECFGQIESYIWAKRNSFVRNEGREAGAGGFIVLERRMGD